MLARSRSVPLCRATAKALLSKPTTNLKTAERSYLWRPWWWDQSHHVARDPFASVQRQMHELERQFDRFWSRPSVGFFDLTPRRPAAEMERFHLEQPIVEEGGVKKFKLVFDASHFKPEHIDIKTSAKRLTISAKHESKEKNQMSKYEYHREFELPEGVKHEEITCKYSSEGQLIVEAPYTPPPPAVEAKEQEIAVKHE